MPVINKLLKKKYSRNISDKRKERQQIYNSKEWKNLRAAYFMEHPLCERCLANGITTVGEDVHHLTSFMNYSNEKDRWNAALDYNNLMTVCRRCHEELHGNVKKKGKH